MILDLGGKQSSYQHVFVGAYSIPFATDGGLSIGLLGYLFGDRVLKGMKQSPYDKYKHKT